MEDKDFKLLVLDTLQALCDRPKGDMSIYRIDVSKAIRKLRPELGPGPPKPKPSPRVASPWRPVLGHMHRFASTTAGHVCADQPLCSVSLYAGDGPFVATIRQSDESHEFDDLCNAMVWCEGSLITLGWEILG